MPISLQEIQKFYAERLENRIFQYTLRGGQVIELVFYKENLCHLLGIQHIIPSNKEYIGIRGYRKIESGVLTTDFLRKHNENQYRQMRGRIGKFMEVANLLLNGSVYRFYFLRQKESKIRADYIVYWHNMESKLYSNLFLARERSLLSDAKKSNAYTAISYTVMKEKDDHDMYIRNQEYKEVEKFQIIKIK
jgi:hypothetical protein